MVKDMPEGIGKKIYCSIFVNKERSCQRVSAFLDSGSDISLIQLPYLKDLLTSDEIEARMINKIKYDLTSFSNTRIDIKFSLLLTISFGLFDEWIEFEFHVINEMPGAPRLLLGADFMRATMLSISYVGATQAPVPELRALLPKDKRITSHYITEKELFSCEAKISMGPYEKRAVEFKLNPATQVLPSQSVLISGGDVGKNLYITSSKSQVMYDPKEGEYYAYAFVHNISPVQVKTSLVGSYEVLSNERTIPVVKGNRHKLSAYSVVQDVAYYPYSKNPAKIELLDKLPELEEDCALVPSRIYRLATESQLAELNDPMYSSKSKETPRPEMEKFYSREHTVILDPEFEDQGELPDKIVLPKGHQISDGYRRRAEDIVVLDNYDPVHRPFIKKIFLDKYPGVLAKSSLDAGDISRTLGHYQIQLKEGETLPRHRKVYFTSPSDSQHLKDILDFLMKENIIVPAKHSGDKGDLTGSAAYLIAKSKPGSSARLIVDFRFVNSLVKSEPNVLPDAQSMLHSMRGSVLYTSLDLSAAYYSVKLTEDSKYITQFVCSAGAYRYNSMPMGLNTACSCFNRLVNKMVHQVPVLDKEGEPEYESENVVRMVGDPLADVICYFDDIIIHTKPLSTYLATVEEHFKTVERVVERLHFHNSRINFEKAQFAKGRISWLGWILQNSFILVNPKRLIKLKEAPFPESQKGVRSFLGLLNSLRIALNFRNLEKASYLTPLTSSTQPFKPTPYQRQVFEELKERLMEQPIFSNVLHPTAEKLLFTDASSADNSSYSCVLAQLIPYEKDEIRVPAYLSLDDPVHRIIFDKGLIYKPAPIISTEAEARHFHSKLTGTEPPSFEYLEEGNFGYTDDQCNNSIFISLQAIQAVYKCKIMDISEMRKVMVDQIKKSVLRLKVNDFLFNCDHHKTRQYLSELQGNAALDDNLICLEGLAYGLNRPMVIISSLPRHVEHPIIRLNSNLSKPPFVFGAYEGKNGIIYRPLYVDRQNCYDLSQHKDRFEIVAYHSRSLPRSKTGRSVLDQELFAILNSLESMKKFIGSAPCTLLSDSRALCMLFAKNVHQSSTRIYRWNLKIKSDYPNLKLFYIKSSENFADFLSKTFSIPLADIPRLALPKIEVGDLSKYLPENKVFTLQEWVTFVETHPNLVRELTEQSPIKTAVVTSSLNTVTRNLERQLKPLAVLQDRLSHSNILTQQKTHLKDLYEKCLSSQNFVYTDEGGKKYKLVNSLIFYLNDGGPQIYVPSNLVGALLAYTHLSSGHGGRQRMLASLENYYFERKSTLVYAFVSRCFPCQIMNKSTHANVIGQYPVNEYPFQCVYCDLIESIGKAGHYEHILMCTCSFSEGIFLFPLRTKSAESVYYALIYGVLQHFNVKLLFTDNAKCFNDKQFIALLATLGIRKLQLSALNPQGKGFAESRVKIAKNLLKKLVVSQPDYNWGGLTYLVSKIINNTVSPRTGYSPNDLIYGPELENSSKSFFYNEMPKLHPLISNQADQISDRRDQLKLIIENTRKQLFEERSKTTEKVNKFKTNRDFKRDDIVLVLDKYSTPGHTRPLKTIYHPSPHIILTTYPVSCKVKRLSDGFITVYHNDFLKKYSKMDNSFLQPPQPVLHGLQKCIYQA